MTSDQTTRHAPPAALDALVPVLVVIRGPGRGRTLQLVADERIVLGKSDGAGMSLPYSGISREHAALTFLPGQGLSVHDLGSTNGTYVETARVDAEGTLAPPGSRLVLGSETELVLRVYRPEELSRLEAGLAAAKALSQLSEREREVAYAVADGLTSAKIAKRLFISPRTVTTHLDHIYGRLDLGSRAALTRLVIEARGALPDEA
ncbi:MAG: LuxR C-terminal-related transcriptional regulator [Myxococcota bacterium]